MDVDAATVASPRHADARAVGAYVGSLFESHGRMVHALCRMLLRAREDAEDATQQTFLLAHRSLLGGAVPEQPEAWLATIARNECYRRLGRRPPDAVPLLDSDGEGGTDPSRVADQRAEVEALCGALAELPAAQRQAIVLREFYGLSYREVAAVLGVSGPAVESLLFKSRRRLQDRLRPLRAASSALILPLGLRDALAAAIPGFSGAASGAAGAGAGAAVLAKLASAPLAAKVSAVVVAAGTGAGITVAEVRDHQAPARPMPAVELRTSEPPPAPSLLVSGGEVAPPEVSAGGDEDGARGGDEGDGDGVRGGDGDERDERAGGDERADRAGDDEEREPAADERDEGVPEAGDGERDRGEEGRDEGVDAEPAEPVRVPEAREPEEDHGGDGEPDAADSGGSGDSDPLDATLDEPVEDE